MESNNPLKKATIYYNPNQTPWGILKFVDTPGRVFLKDSLKLNKLTITNFDSLKFIYDQIEHATRDSISFDYQEVYILTKSLIRYSWTDIPTCNTTTAFFEIAHLHIIL